VPPPIANALPAASGALSPSPQNAKFTRGAIPVSYPTNWDFEDGLNGWSTSCASSTSGGQSGNYLSIGCSATADSSAFTVASLGSTFSFYLKGTDYASVSVAVGPGYSSWTQVFFGPGTGNWVAHDIDLSSYATQSIKLRYRTFGSNGFDEGAGRNHTPNWTKSGTPTWQAAATVPTAVAALGDFYHSTHPCFGADFPATTTTATLLAGNDSILSTEPFTIPDDPSQIAFHFGTIGTASMTISLYFAGDGYTTPTPLFNDTFSNGQGVLTFCDLSDFAGLKAKVKLASSTGGSLNVALAGEVLSYNAGLIEEDVSSVTGVPTQRVTDLAIPGKGVSLDFTRSYAPVGLVVPGSLGWGWSHTYDTRLTIVSDGSVVVKYAMGPSAFFENISSTLTPPAGSTDTLVQNLDDSYTLTTKSHIRFNYDEDGKLTSIVDRNDNSTTIAYDVSGFLDTVTDPGGREFDFTVDGSGRVTQVEDPLTRTVSYSYNADGDLEMVTDVLGGETDYTYSNHRLETITDQLNHTQLTLTYDDANRVVEKKDALDNITCYYYGNAPAYTSGNCAALGGGDAPAEGETVAVDPRGNLTTTQYDESFRITGVADALGNDTTYVYETGGAPCSPANTGNRCAITDALSHETSFTYDSDHNMLTRTDAASETWTYTYNGFNDVLTEVDPLTRTTTYEYNGDGNLIGVTNAKTEETVYAPNADGTLDSVTDPLTNETTFTYDTYGNVLVKTDPLTNDWTYTYDLGGRVLTMEDPLGNTTTYTYDDAGNVLTTSDALGHVTSTTYNAKGAKLSMTDANRQAFGGFEAGAQCGTPGTGDGDDDDADGVVDDGCPNATFEYDDQDRLTAVNDTKGNAVEFGYDENGNRISMINTRSEETTYDYDELNRVTLVVDPLLRETSYEYDEVGRLISRTDGNTLKTEYGYTDVNQLETVDYPDTTPDVTFTYDELGNRLTMVDGTGTTIWDRDELYRPTTVTDGATDEVGYSYDAAGRLEELTYPGGIDSVIYDYDDAGRLTTVTDWDSNVTGYDYDDANRLTATTLPNGISTQRSYDAAGRLLSMRNDRNDGSLSSYGYDMDAVGNRTAMVARTDSYEKTVLADGPVGFWRLDEPSGTNAADVSGRSNTGTYTNSPTLAQTGAIESDPNDSTDFDGTNDYVSVAASSSLNDLTQFSAEGWIYLDSFGENVLGRFLQKTNANAIYVVGSTTNALAFESLRWSTDGKWRTPNNSLTTGQWYHIAIAYDYGSTSNDPRIYINGVLQTLNETQAPSGSVSSETGTLYIGNNDSGSSRTFDGRIDDVAVYDYLLSPAAVQQHYKQLATHTQSSLVLADGPVAYWKLGEPTGTTATDLSGKSNTGTYVNSPTLGGDGGIVGDPDTAVEFDGTDDTVSVAASASLNDLTKVTAEGWIYLDSFGESSLGRFFQKTDANQLMVSGANGTVQFEALRWSTDGKWRTPNGSIQTKKWYHLVVSYDYGSSSNDPKVYINGLLQTLTESQAPSGSVSSETGTLYIGNNLDATRSFDGRIDEVALYDYILPPAAVAQHLGEHSVYAYSKSYELTNALYPNGDTQGFAYDEMGNRLTQVVNGVTTLDYTYDEGDQMTDLEGVTYDYDDNGNQIEAGSDTFSWDGENRLVETDIDSVTSSYEYDGTGLRTSRTIGAAARAYTWNLRGNSPTVIQDSDGNRFVYGLDLIAQIAPGGEQYFLSDGLGSTTGMANDTAAIVGAYEYDAFGVVRSQSGTTTDWSYTGELNDPTGLEYLRARYYDPVSGRFLSQDPAARLQEYSYGDNNPMNLVDPSGLAPSSDYMRRIAGAASSAAAASGNPFIATGIYATAAMILRDPCWLTHAFCPHPPFKWKDVRRRTRDTGDLIAAAYYPVYYGSYQAQGAMDKIPSTPLTDPFTDPIRRALCVAQITNLIGNIIGDAIEKYPGGKDEPLFDDHRVKETAPFNRLPFIDDREFLPGIGQDDDGWHVDIRC
jgi:RHS repeat-associated protein